jgi:hypothetical protein
MLSPCCEPLPFQQRFDIVERGLWPLVVEFIELLASEHFPVYLKGEDQDDESKAER